ncbi:MAG: HAD hydrolase-like protein [Tannerella sp.]|jgi:beta-phosphoglucomutase-like phosphatase (HAD superfamily)|nr:HAD hydrolase-like protein [Tannerella sp.]
MDSKQTLRTFLAACPDRPSGLKAILFDMDGVLYDSMPQHVQAWVETMTGRGFRFAPEDAYLHEGRTGAGTIRLLCEREGIVLSDDEVEELYRAKTELFQTLPPPRRISGAYEVLQQTVRSGLSPMIVTGSGQPDLLDRLREEFPGIPFSRERMVTGFDVTYGKPHPEPYLMALEKGRLQPRQAAVVENAPLGIASARAAGLFVLAVNTGPLPDTCLAEAGAHVIFSGMSALGEAWEDIAALSGEERER